MNHKIKTYFSHKTHNQGLIFHKHRGNISNASEKLE